MQYRIQYLDGLANIIRELSADARSGMSAFEFVADMPWVARTCMGLFLSSHFWRLFPSRPGSAPATERNGGVRKPPAATRSAHFSASMAGMASSGPSRE